MRFDSNRKDIEINCKIKFFNKEIDGTAINLSLTGCRLIIPIQFLKDINIGSSIDLSLILNFDLNINFIGNVINVTKNQLGITFSAINEIDYLNLKLFLKDKHIETIHKYHKNDFCNNTKKRVLILGPGGGKFFSQLKMCQLLEEELGLSIYDFFDDFVGVSSGGLLSAMILKYRSLKIIEEKLLNINFKPSFNLFPFESILQKNDLFNKVKVEFDKFEFKDSGKTLYLQSRNYISGIMHCLIMRSNPSNSLYRFLQKSISIPSIFGSTDDFMDGAVGGYLNPTELYFRFLGMENLLKNINFCLYLDAGFDPNYNNGLFSKNIINQILWSLKIAQRDSLFNSIENINIKFPRINYKSYFFTFPKSFDVLNFDDYNKASIEFEKLNGQYKEWIQSYIIPFKK